MLQWSVNHVLIETGAQHLVKSMCYELRPRSRLCQCVVLFTLLSLAKTIGLLQLC